MYVVTFWKRCNRLLAHFLTIVIWLLNWIHFYAFACGDSLSENIEVYMKDASHTIMSQKKPNPKFYQAESCLFNSLITLRTLHTLYRPIHARGNKIKEKEEKCVYELIINWWARIIYKRIVWIFSRIVIYFVENKMFHAIWTADDHWTVYSKTKQHVCCVLMENECQCSLRIICTLSWISNLQVLSLLLI